MKNNVIFRIIIGLVAVLFFAVALVIGILCNVLSPNFWVNNVMMLLIFGACIFATFKFKTSKEYIPFAAKYVSYITGYVIYIAIVSLSLMFIKKLHWLIPLLIHIASLIIFAIILYFKSFGARHIKEVNEKQKADVAYLRLLETKLVYAHDLSDDVEIKTTLSKLIRQVQNSTYNSFAEVKDIELELLNLADELSEANLEDQPALIKKITVLLNKRNNMISMLRG